MLEMMKLPYTYDSLEPYYDKETLQLHYEKLYTGYIDNTNKTEKKLELARKTKDYSNIKCLEKDLSFYGSGAILHQLFFENLTKPNGSGPSEGLKRQIEKDFGSFDNFKMQFTEAAIAVEGSGWTILAWVPKFNKLEILQCEKHQNLTLWGCNPILVIDMWEHSYYLQYKTNRAEYINSWWNIVNWSVVNKRI